MDDVATDVDGQVASDASWSSGVRVGGTDDVSCQGDCTVAFPDHGDNRTRGDEANQPVEKWFAFVLAVVLLSFLGRELHEFETDEFETTLLEATDDFSDQSSFYAVWLDCNKGSFY